MFFSIFFRFFFDFFRFFFRFCFRFFSNCTEDQKEDENEEDDGVRVEKIADIENFVKNNIFQGFHKNISYYQDPVNMQNNFPKLIKNKSEGAVQNIELIT